MTVLESMGSVNKKEKNYPMAVAAIGLLLFGFVAAENESSCQRGPSRIVEVSQPVEPVRALQARPVVEVQEMASRVQPVAEVQIPETTKVVSKPRESIYVSGFTSESDKPQTLLDPSDFHQQISYQQPEVKKRGNIAFYPNSAIAKQNMLKNSIMVTSEDYVTAPHGQAQAKKLHQVPPARPMPTQILFSSLGLGGKGFPFVCARDKDGSCRTEDDVMKDVSSDIRNIFPDYRKIFRMVMNIYTQARVFIIAPTLNVRLMVYKDWSGSHLIHMGLLEVYPYIPCLSKKRGIPKKNPTENLFLQDNNGIWQLDGAGRPVARLDKIIAGTVREKQKKVVKVPNPICDIIPGLLNRCRKGLMQNMPGCTREGTNQFVRLA